MLDFKRKTSTYLELTHMLREYQHDLVSKLLQTLQDCGDELCGRPSHFRPGPDWFYAMRFFSAISLETLVAYFGIVSTDDEEIAKGERHLLLSPPSSAVSSPLVPQLRGELRRSERIARKILQVTFLVCSQYPCQLRGVTAAVAISERGPQHPTGDERADQEELHRARADNQSA